MEEARNVRDYVGPTAFLQRESAENEIVFNTDWSDFPLLYHLNPHNRYVAGLGPHYVHKRSRSTHILWRKLIEGRQPSPSSIILNRFGARWVFGKRNAPLIQKLRKDHGALLAYEDNYAVIFRIEGGNGPV